MTLLGLKGFGNQGIRYLLFGSAARACVASNMDSAVVRTYHSRVCRSLYCKAQGQQQEEVLHLMTAREIVSVAEQALLLTSLVRKRPRQCANNLDAFRRVYREA